MKKKETGLAHEAKVIRLLVSKIQKILDQPEVVPDVLSKEHARKVMRLEIGLEQDIVLQHPMPVLIKSLQNRTGRKEQVRSVKCLRVFLSHALDCAKKLEEYQKEDALQGNQMGWGKQHRRTTSRHVQHVLRNSRLFQLFSAQRRISSQA
jgi:hypothetical protein